MGGVPVVMVHGFASSFERNWREPGWVDLLAEQGREVIGVDLLGHGTAAKPHDPRAYAELERSVLAVLPQDRMADAIGFSLGGQILLRAAATAPDRFRKIVIGGVADNVFTSPASELTAHAIETGEYLGRDPVSAAIARFAKAPGNDPAALAACLRRPPDALTEADLGGVSVSVLVVVGEKDFAGSADRMIAALPDARLLPLPGMDHFGTPKDFRFVEAALDFIRG